MLLIKKRINESSLPCAQQQVSKHRAHHWCSHPTLVGTRLIPGIWSKCECCWLWDDTRHGSSGHHQLSRVPASHSHRFPGSRKHMPQEKCSMKPPPHAQRAAWQAFLLASPCSNSKINYCLKSWQEAPSTLLRLLQKDQLTPKLGVFQEEKDAQTYRES